MLLSPPWIRPRLDFTWDHILVWLYPRSLWFSYISVYQDHLKIWLNNRSLVPPPDPLGWVLTFFVSSKFPGDANTAPLWNHTILPCAVSHTPLWIFPKDIHYVHLNLCLKPCFEGTLPKITERAGKCSSQEVQVKDSHRHWGSWKKVSQGKFHFFKFLLLFNYSCVPFLPIPPPHPSQTHLPPPPQPSLLILSMCPL